MYHDKSYYLKKTKHTEEFRVHNHWIWCFTASVKWRKRRKTISVHEDDSGHKMSNMWRCDFPHMQTEDATEPWGAMPLQNISLRLLITQTPHLMVLSPSQEEKKTSLYQVKNPCVRFFCSAKIPFSIVFPNFDREGGIPANQDMRHKNAKGFHVAWPKPSRSGPAARIEPFPHQMCPIRGNLKLSPGGIQLHP